MLVRGLPHKGAQLLEHSAGCVSRTGNDTVSEDTIGGAERPAPSTVLLRRCIRQGVPTPGEARLRAQVRVDVLVDGGPLPPGWRDTVQVPGAHPELRVQVGIGELWKYIAWSGRLRPA